MLSLDYTQVLSFWPEFYLDDVVSLSVHPIWRHMTIVGRANCHHRLKVLSFLHCAAYLKTFSHMY